jgi:hypothetical protein
MTKQISKEMRNNLTTPYSVQGDFMPNSLTVDQNSNRRVDILRCSLRNSEVIHLTRLPLSDESLSVSIYREEKFLLSFNIPWKTRRMGFSLSSPDIASQFNAWNGYPNLPSLNKNKNFDASNNNMSKVNKSDNNHNTQKNITLFMCVPGFESPISQRSLTVYAEFIQHHLLVGVQHMFIAGPYAWTGLNMLNLISAFQSYIEEGLLTISSLAGDDEELVYSILGVSLDRDNMKVIHVNMCLYLSKGVADYVGVWDNGKLT